MNNSQYLVNLIEEKVKFIDSKRLDGKIDIEGLCHIFVLNKYLKKEHIDLIKINKIEHIHKLLLNNKSEEILKQKILIAFDLFYQDKRGEVLDLIHDLKKTDNGNLEIVKPFNRKGLIGVISYEYEI